jgi:hypothetical protein
MDPATFTGFADVLKLIGGTSPLVALLAWHLWTMRADMKEMIGKQEATNTALHDLDKRLAVTESFVQYNTSDKTRQFQQPQS